MLPSPASPSQPAEEGARRLALTHLEAARVARGRLVIPTDAEGLHDYRVALRRLRSCLRSYRRELRSTVTRKSLRRLRRLARATNRSRDLEVHTAWLADQAPTAGEAEQPGIGWLSARLERARAHAREEMLAKDAHLFSALHPALHRQLSRYRTTIHLDPTCERRTLSEATSRHVHAAARRLERRLQRVRDETAEDEIHRARIAAKHLRYLLEPFSAGLPGGDDLVERLKSLQDGLGDAHDALVFLPELAEASREAENDRPARLGPGLRALADALGLRGTRAFDSVAREWLVPGRRTFFDALRSASQALEQLSRPAAMSRPSCSL